MKDLTPKQDNTAGDSGQYDAAEFNNFHDEGQNVVTSSGQTLDATGTDVDQLSKGIANYTAVADSYAVSGGVNARVLTPVSPFEGPTGYVDGMRVRANIPSANTGSMTVNVNSLGAISVRNAGVVVAAGEVNGDIELVYDDTNSWFSLVRSGSGTLSKQIIGGTNVDVSGTTSRTISLPSNITSQQVNGVSLDGSGGGTSFLADDGSYKAVSGGAQEETGTWTPSTSMVTASTGDYYRVGDLVYCELTLSTSDNTSDPVAITGFPFSIDSREVQGVVNAVGIGSTPLQRGDTPIFNKAAIGGDLQLVYFDGSINAFIDYENITTIEGAFIYTTDDPFTIDGGSGPSGGR